MGAAYSGFKAISSFVVTPAGRRRHPHALHAAAKSGDVEAAKALIRDGCQVDLCNEVGCTPLHFAAREGHREMVELLLEAGARTGPSNTVGSTPLHWAADAGHTDVVGLLCEAGANTEATTQIRSTPLHLAAKKGHEDSAERLLQHGSNIMAANQDRRLPIHLAARYGHSDVLVLLLEADCDTVHATDKDLRTPLHLAALGGHQDAVEVLTDMDAATDVRDRLGLTPLELGAESGLDVFAREDLPSCMEATLGDSFMASMDPLKDARINVTPVKAPPKKAAEKEEQPNGAVASPAEAPSAPAWTGPAAALMQRLDPRLRYLVTPEALEALEEQQGEGGGEDGGSDSDSDAGAPVVSTLSGISLQFDVEEVKWERPVDNLLRQSLRAAVSPTMRQTLPKLKVAASLIRAPLQDDGSEAPSAPPCPSPLRKELGMPSPAGKPPVPPRSPLTQRYRTMPYEELHEATGGFAPHNLLGEGGFGAVYRGTLGNGTAVAVKTLDRSGLQGTTQFRCEVKVLSRVRHPHVVRLLGSCPGRGSLVYELLGGGSLEDRLECKGGSEPLTWRTRVCIAFEMAAGLLYLHNSKPDSVVHRDFKPANVLLDEHLGVKLGDVGLARLAPELASSMAQASHVQDSTPVGTFHYIDPEYMRTGQLSQRSDVYSLGITLLELLTGLPPTRVVEAVEEALEQGSIAPVLDSKAGDWPLDMAESLARLALGAAEMKRRQRPDLEVEILPMLRGFRSEVLEDQLGDVLARAEASPPGSILRTQPPMHFRCPISQALMQDPVVASDGFAYERASLEQWLEETDVSPLTNARLEDSSVHEAAFLLRAIERWSSLSAAPA